MECLYEYYEGYNIMLYWILNCYGMFERVLWRVYYYVIMNVKLLWNVCMSVMKDLLLSYREC
jgi:hypothetical protein